MNTIFKTFAVLAAVAVLLFAVSAISFGTFAKITESASARKQTFALINHAGDFLSNVRDAETGQRGYALTGNVTFLQPYLAVRDSIRDRLNDLRRATTDTGALHHLDVVAPLVSAKMAELSNVIDLRRRGDVTAVVAMVSGGEGKRLMDSIRVEMARYIEVEERALAHTDAQFQSDMRQLLTVIVGALLLTVVAAAVFGWLIRRDARHQLASLVHHETQRLLTRQEEMTAQLQQANSMLQVSEERLAVTLNSIGDAVIATDASGRITILNPLAAQLTGWTLEDASGHLVDEVFHIVNEETRERATVPVLATLEQGTTHALANHTVVIARDGSECPIADSCAPIRTRTGQVVGAVLVFRDVSQEHTAQQTVRDTSAQIQAILSTVVDGIITVRASDRVVQTMNPAAERMFGYATAEIAGRPVTLLIPNFNSGGGEAEGLRQDGRTLPLELAVSDMQLGGQVFFTAVLRDITRRKQVEAERVKLDQRLRDQYFYTRSLVESNIDALMTCDPRGIITDVNKQTEALTGCSRDELIGAPFKNYFTDAIRAQAGLDLVLAEGKVTDYELTARNTNGTHTVVSINATTFRDRDRKPQGVFASARDMTALKRIERTLQQKNAELEKANRLKTEFVSNKPLAP